MVGDETLCPQSAAAVVAQCCLPALPKSPISRHLPPRRIRSIQRRPLCTTSAPIAALHVTAAAAACCRCCPSPRPRRWAPHAWPSMQSVTLHTNLGDLKLELFCEDAPRTCENFLALCASGYYDGTLFHRNIKAFMIQVHRRGLEEGGRMS